MPDEADQLNAQPGQQPLQGERRERRENFEVMLRRFFRDQQQSGILSEVKRRRFREKPLSRGKRREVATRKAARRRAKRGY